MNKHTLSLSCVALLCILSSTSSIVAEEADMKLHKKEPTPFVKGSWTVVVIPDTQHYLHGDKNNVDSLNKMMDWIVEKKDERDIKMVVHVGDMTAHHNDPQWALIRESYKKLDDKVPYLVCEGNHDHGKKGTPLTLMNGHFKLEQNPLNKKIFGGWREEGRMENSWYEMKINGLDYLFITIGLNPKVRKANFAWAAKVVDEYPDHRVFVTHHIFLSEEGRLLSKDGKPPLGERYTSFVKPRKNIEFLTCGHVGVCGIVNGKLIGYKKDTHTELATAHRSEDKPGLRFHAVLMNAQFIKGGGQGWMLLMEFSKDNKSVIVKTFSPDLGQWRTGKEYEYTLMRN